MQAAVLRRCRWSSGLPSLDIRSSSDGLTKRSARGTSLAILVAFLVIFFFPSSDLGLLTQIIQAQALNYRIVTSKWDTQQTRQRSQCSDNGKERTTNNRGSIPLGQGISVLRSIHTGSLAYLVSYYRISGTLPLGLQAHHSPLSSAEFKKAWSYAAIPVNAFMFWCLIKLKAKFPFTFNMQA